MEGHGPLLAENGVEMDIVADLTEGDLEKPQINLGDRKRLMRAINSLTQDPAAPMVTPAQTTTDAERLQLTVMFCDLADSTALP